MGIEAGATALENTALALSKLDAGAIKSFKSAEEVNATMLSANKFLSPGQEWAAAWKPGEQGGAAGGGNQIHFVMNPQDKASVFKFVSAKEIK